MKRTLGLLFPWLWLPTSAWAQVIATPIDPDLAGSPPDEAPAPPIPRGAAAVGPNVLVNDRALCPNGRGLQQNETAIAVGGGGDVVVVAFNDARGAAGACQEEHAAVGWGYSLDGGATFTDGGALPGSALFSGGDPWLGVSPDGGTFYLSGLRTGLQGIGFYRGVLDGGRIAWDEPTVISFPGHVMDKEAFAVDPSTNIIHLAYTRLGQRVYVTTSFDAGHTWTPAATVRASFAQGAFPVVDNLSTLYIAYNVGWPGANQAATVARSLDGGATFSEVVSFPFSTQAVPYVDRSPSFPQLAVDTSGGCREGWVYMVWHATLGGVVRPVISHSEDHGTTWSAPIPVNSDTTNAYHWSPTVSIDQAGNVHVLFLDRRENPGTGYTDVYLAQSTDGGLTFVDQPVTDVTSTWQGVAFDGGFTAAGDYMKALAYGTNVLAAWTDPRNGDPDIYFAKIDAGDMTPPFFCSVAPTSVPASGYSISPPRGSRYAATHLPRGRSPSCGRRPWTRG